jgi:malonyl-CoA O-methyltransferase
VADDQWVFIHGWGSDSSLWRSLCELLPGQHHFVDLPGYGGAAADSADLEYFLVRVAGKLPDNCILLGWSLGGMIATQLAGLYPHKIRALVTLATNAVFVAREGWSQAMAQSTFTGFLADFREDPVSTWSRFCALQSLGDGHRKQVLKLLKEQVPPSADTHTAWLEGLNWLTLLDNRELLSRLQIPQLHLLGAGDSLVPAACAPALAGLLPANGRVEVLAELGHAPHLSDPARVATVLRQWLYPPIDKSRIAHSFGQAASRYDQYAHVQRRVARDMVNFCPIFGPGERVLDLGCGTGFVAQLLAGQGPELLLADLALPMVQLARDKLPETAALVADAESLPLTTSSLNAIVSSLTLQWCQDLAVVAQEAARVLRPRGQLIFSTLGPSTLWELKCAWQSLDQYTHVNHFQSAPEIRAELESGGLRILALESYALVVHYTELVHLLKELKAIGAHNMNSGRKPGLTGAAQLRTLERCYREFAEPDGRLPATYDVILVRAERPI